jgi:hypothetical protein
MNNQNIEKHTTDNTAKEGNIYSFDTIINMFKKTYTVNLPGWVYALTALLAIALILD